jgi:murein DD-endopeptidase MepM/ murein hydrolase activator NlpD
MDGRSGTAMQGRRGSTAGRGAVVVMVLAGLLATSPGAAQQAERAELDRARQRIDAVRAELATSEQVAERAALALADAEALLARMEEVVNDVAEAVARQEATVRRAQSRLGEIEADRERLTAAVGRRMVELHKRGPGLDLEILLGSQGVQAAGARVAYLQVVSGAERGALERLAAADVAVAAERERFEGEHARLERLLDEQRAILDEVEQLRATRALTAADARERARSLAAQLDDLESEEVRLVELIAQRQEEARLRADAQQRALGRASDAREAAEALARTRPTSSSGYAWPMCRPVTSEYGPRWGRLHRGIDQGAPPGTAVHATKAGVVIFAEYYGGFGRLVLIDHHDGVVTASAHLSRFDVTAGTRVERGDIIGAVGSTGASTGPHLHLEFRVNGQAQDPRRYLPVQRC